MPIDIRHHAIQRLLDGHLRRANAIEIGRRAAQGRVISRHPFEHMTKLQQIKLGFGIALQQGKERVGQTTAQFKLHISTATLAPVKQASGLEPLDRLAHRGTRYAKLHRKLALRQQLLPRLQ
mgnify:CR=1 FL=1